MPRELIVKGQASGKTLFSTKEVFPKDTNLLDYLRKKGIPVASSCYGDGVCKKCVVILNGKNVLSCEISSQNLFMTHLDKIVIIEIEYL